MELWPSSTLPTCTSRLAISRRRSTSSRTASRAGNRYQTLLGATGTGKTATMAWTIEKIGKPALVIAHNKTLAAQLCNEFREFFPDNAVEYFVSYYDYYQPEAYVPQSDLYIEKSFVTKRGHLAPPPRGDVRADDAQGRGDRGFGLLHLRHRLSGRVARPRADPERRVRSTSATTPSAS